LKYGFEISVKGTIDEYIIRRQPYRWQAYFFELWTVFAADRALAIVIVPPFVAGARTYWPVTELRPTRLGMSPLLLPVGDGAVDAIR
jgi:hypothetical protein